MNILCRTGLKLVLPVIHEQEAAIFTSNEVLDYYSFFTERVNNNKTLFATTGAMKTSAGI